MHKICQAIAYYLDIKFEVKYDNMRVFHIYARFSNLTFF